MTTSKRDVTSAFLRALADAVDSLDEGEFNELLAAARLKALIPPKPAVVRPKAVRQDQKVVSERARSMMKDLLAQSSLEYARAYLDDVKPTRAILETAARLREIHTTKQDTVEILKDKLIANVIGSRLDSQAIRNA